VTLSDADAGLASARGRILANLRDLGDDESALARVHIDEPKPIEFVEFCGPGEREYHRSQPASVSNPTIFIGMSSSVDGARRGLYSTVLRTASTGAAATSA
jgi:hypothetical protein